MLKTRKKADSPTTQNLQLVWDNKPDEGRRKNVNITLETRVSPKDASKPEHDETAEDAVNALLGAGNEEETMSLPPTVFGRGDGTPQNSNPAASAPKQTEQQQNADAEEPQPEEENEEPQEILEINDNESLGDALTRLRGSLNYSLVDLANKTKIPIHKIEALEEGNYEELKDINIGKDYVRKLCTEYMIPPEKYILKFKDEYQKFCHTDEEPSPVPNKGKGLPPIDTAKKPVFVSIPSILIGALIIILCLFIVGGLAKLHFRKTVVRLDTKLSELVPVNRGSMSTLPMPETK